MFNDNNYILEMAILLDNELTNVNLNSNAYFCLSRMYLATTFDESIVKYKYRWFMYMGTTVQFIIYLSNEHNINAKQRGFCTNDILRKNIFVT